MKKYLHKCPKPTLVWSNSPVVRFLDKGPVTRAENNGPKTVRQYISKKTGKTGYGGTDELKKTEMLARTFKNYNITLRTFDAFLFRFGKRAVVNAREYPAKYAAYLVELIPSFLEIRGTLPKARCVKVCLPPSGR